MDKEGNLKFHHTCPFMCASLHVEWYPLIYPHRLLQEHKEHKVQSMTTTNRAQVSERNLMQL